MLSKSVPCSGSVLVFATNLLIRMMIVDEECETETQDYIIPPDKLVSFRGQALVVPTLCNGPGHGDPLSKSPNFKIYQLNRIDCERGARRLDTSLFKSRICNGFGW